MLLVDFNQFLMTSTHLSCSKPSDKLDPDQIRYLVLNQLRANNVKFRPKYGRMVIACDDPKFSWRKKVFPYYKAHRKNDREKFSGHIDWPAAFQLFREIKSELEEYSSYIVIQVDGAEGDDVIATLASEIKDEPHMIISSDKDFGQLQRHFHVSQWDPIKQKQVIVSDPDQYLFEHIINGDRNDGVPNILSDDDVLINPAKRQGKVTAKRMEAWTANSPRDGEDANLRRNFRRNEVLISLDKTPQPIKQAIIDQFNDRAQKENEHKMFSYIKKYKLIGLMDRISDF